MSSAQGRTSPEDWGSDRVTRGLAIARGPRRGREGGEISSVSAEGVGFEPTEALRLQRFSRWRSAFANANKLERFRALSEFVVPAPPASSRLVSTRWLYTWLYRKRGIGLSGARHDSGDADASEQLRALNRLNAHYQPTLALAQFILRCVSFALKEGASLAPRFLIDMNDLFQSYVEALIEKRHRRLACDASRPPACISTRDGSEPIRPDILLASAKARFAAVLDAKYKRESAREDLYQAPRMRPSAACEGSRWSIQTTEMSNLPGTASSVRRR